MQSGIEEAERAGIQIVAISHDTTKVLKQFSSANKIEYPLLADPDSNVIRQFGLLNSAGKKGSPHYAISHPMIVLVGSDGIVRATIPETVQQRSNIDQILDAWKKVATSPSASPSPALDFVVTDISGHPVKLSKYAGKVVVIVNTASRFGFTPQYKSLQQLYAQHEKDGLAILGFPCNQFGKQEPGTEATIQKFCKVNYGVTFDLFSKIEVKGKNASPLFKYLTSLETKPVGKGDVKWNFEKFVIDRKGDVVARFGSRVTPDSDQFTELVTRLLDETPPSKAASEMKPKANPEGDAQSEPKSVPPGK